MRKITVLVNRAARNGCDRRRLDAIRREFAADDLAILTPESYEALVQAAQEATRDGTDLVLVVGGDGTVNAVANQLAHSPVPLGIIPAGTANDLATQLGIPLNPRKACRMIRQGAATPIDLIRINDRYFVTAGGLGVLSDTAVGVNVLKARQGLVRKATKTFGSLVYVLYSFMLLLFSRRILSDFTVSIDGEDLGTLRSVALFVNNQPSIGKFVCSYPGAKMTDGKLGLCLMRERSRLQSIATVILMSLKGAHTGRKDVLMREGGTLTITSPEPKVFIGDGEVLAKTRTLELEVVPRALRVISGRLLADDAYLEVRVKEGAVPEEQLGAALR
ncbi:Diacylglycerol kinase [compost metagenome]